ncbi:MAG: Asp-tRNA(Asn)/Glu-tRNA(Gln) amidotransferase subunit GatA [Elusimicrobiota bacterium]
MTAPLQAFEIAGRVRAGEIRAESVAAACLDAIRDRDPGLRAFVRTMGPEALEAAREVDRKAARGERLGPLAGVPVALKDNILLRGVPTACGSRILEGYVAPYDAAVVERLKAADAVIVGKTNMDEFAMGSSTEHSAFFPTRNPWDVERVPGGSSGGSAAAVAAGLVPLALGSDTGGSVRQPAAFCGVVGLKPTYGRVSRYGLVAFASSLDQVGPLARTVSDAALGLSVISGHDPRDSTSSPGLDEDLLRLSQGGCRGLRIGLPREYFPEGLDPEVSAAVRGAAEVLAAAGAELADISLPHTRYAVSAYYIIAPSEASANLARYDGVRYGRRAAGEKDLLSLYEASRGEGFGPEVKRRIMLGTYALSAGYYEAYYLRAQRARRFIRRDFDEAFRSVDLILTPVSPAPAFRFGEKADPLQMYLADVFTLPCNLAGLGGISIPCGVTRSGLPVGAQLMCRPFGEGLLLRAARSFEAAKPFPRLEEKTCG